MEVQEEEEVFEQVSPVGKPWFSSLLTGVSGGWNGRGGLGTGNSGSVSCFKEMTDPGF